jgi:hypothetical protein
MKKIVVLLALVMPLLASAADRPVEFDQLPSHAKAFVAKYFADAKVSFATVDREPLETSYDVTFVDGRKVEFNAKGEWTEVDCRRSAVPAGIIPKAVAKYVAAHHPDNFVCEASRDRRDCEVTLDNGLELKFNHKFALVEIDN